MGFITPLLMPHGSSEKEKWLPWPWWKSLAWPFVCLVIVAATFGFLYSAMYWWPN